MITSTPNTTQASSPFSISPLLTARNDDNRLAQATVIVAISSLAQSSSGPRGLSAGAIVGIIIAIAIMIIFATGVFVLLRRRIQRNVVSDLNDPIYISSPTYDNKEYMSDPFLTDIQAKGLGFDTSQQVTRRIEAKFIQIDSPSVSRKNSDSTSQSSPYIPHVLVGDGEATECLSSSEHRPHSLASHETCTQHSLDMTSFGSRGSSPEARSDSLESVVASSHADITHRMSDVFAQDAKEHAAAS